MVVAKSRIVRACLYILGIISILLGIAGIILPVLPGTPFILLAAWCFLKSSERTYQWMCRQPVVGVAIKNWEKNKSISRRIKILALFMISISLVSMWVKNDNFWINAPVTAILFVVSVYIVTRKESA